MWPDRVSSPGPLAFKSDGLPTALRGGHHGSIFRVVLERKKTPYNRIIDR